MLHKILTTWADKVFFRAPFTGVVELELDILMFREWFGINNVTILRNTHLCLWTSSPAGGSDLWVTTIDTMVLNYPVGLIHGHTHQ